MAEQRQMDWLRVHNAGHVGKIGAFLKGRSVNTYSPKFDRNDKPYITLGWDDRPDSDWGRYRGSSAAVWFADEGLAALGEAAVRKALGFPEAGAFFTPTKDIPQ